MAVVLKNKVWVVIQSRVGADWVIVENDDYKITCYDNGNIKIMDKHTSDVVAYVEADKK